MTSSSAEPTAPPAGQDDIRRLLDSLRARVRADAQLGPRCVEGLVPDEAAALQALPAADSAQAPEPSWAQFERCLVLLRQTLAELQRPALQPVADALALRIAQRIAQRLSARERLQPPPAPWLRELPAGLAPYKQTPLFTHDTLPAALQGTHTIKAGSWGLLRVVQGALVFTLDEGVPRTLLLSAGEQLVIEPQVPHHVSFVTAGAMQISFCRPEVDPAV